MISKKTILTVAFLAVLVLPVLVYAQGLPLPSNPYGNQGGDAIRLQEVEDIINKVARFLIGIAMVVAVAAIIAGGIVYMTAGGDDERAKRGRSIIFQGIIGAAVVLAVGVILNTLSGLITRSFFG